jgi:DNA modification methylase
VTIYHGDCLALLPLMEAGSVDCVVTDPPYGIAYSSGCGSDTWGDGAIEGDLDTQTRDSALSLIEMPSLIFGTWRRARPKGTRQVLIWDTLGALGMGDLRLPWKPSHQEIYVLGNSDGFCGYRGSDVIRFPPVQSMAKNGRVHPFEKPVGLIEILIGWLSGQSILDPFLGSGTTAVACIRTGRKCIGIELEEKYCETAAKRCDRELDQGRLFKPEPKVRETQMVLA